MATDAPDDPVGHLDEGGRDGGEIHRRTVAASRNSLGKRRTRPGYTLLAPPPGQCRPAVASSRPDSLSPFSLGSPTGTDHHRSDTLGTTPNGQSRSAPCRRGSTTLASSTTAVASASSSTCRAARAGTLVDQALTALCNLNHRGAAGAEPDTGDGAGHPRPDARRASTGRSSPSSCRRVGAYATGIAFLPTDDADAATKDAVEKVLADEGFTVLGWRDGAGRRRRARCQRARGDARVPAGVRRPRTASRGDELERHVYVARKRIEHETDAYFPSLSARVVVYKGMLTPDQVERVLRATCRTSGFESALCLVHSRFSTNTFPSLAARAPVPDARAQRRDQHRAGQRELDARARGRDGDRRAARRRSSASFPICTPGASDTARFDEALELLHAGGPAAAPRDPDDDPGGVGEPRVDGRARARRSTATTRR